MHPISHLIRRPEILSSATPATSPVMACIPGEFSVFPIMLGISRIASSFIPLRHSAEAQDEPGHQALLSGRVLDRAYPISTNFSDMSGCRSQLNISHVAVDRLFPSRRRPIMPPSPALIAAGAPRTSWPRPSTPSSANGERCSPDRSRPDPPLPPLITGFSSNSERTIVGGLLPADPGRRAGVACSLRSREMPGNCPTCLPLPCTITMSIVRHKTVPDILRKRFQEVPMTAG